MEGARDRDPYFPSRGGVGSGLRRLPSPAPREKTWRPRAMTKNARPGQRVAVTRASEAPPHPHVVSEASRSHNTRARSHAVRQSGPCVVKRSGPRSTGGASKEPHSCAERKLRKQRREHDEVQVRVRRSLNGIHRLDVSRARKGYLPQGKLLGRTLAGTKSSNSPNASDGRKKAKRCASSPLFPQRNGRRLSRSKVYLGRISIR